MNDIRSIDAAYYQAFILFVEEEYSLFTPPIASFEALLAGLRHAPPEQAVGDPHCAGHDAEWQRARMAVDNGYREFNERRMIKTRKIPRHQKRTGIFRPLDDHGNQSPEVVDSHSTEWMERDYYYYLIMMNYLECSYHRFQGKCESMEYFLELMSGHCTPRGMPFSHDPGYWPSWQEIVAKCKAA